MDDGLTAEAESEIQPTDVFSFQLHGRENDGLQVVSFSGRETVSRPYTFRIQLAVPDEIEDLEDSILGTDGRLVFMGRARPRVVRGVVRTAVSLALGQQPGFRGCEVCLVPRLWLLGKTRMSRIFQEKSVPEIVDIVFDRWDVPRRWALQAKYVARRYCVQYKESDLAFVRRILAEEGIFFFFAQPSSGSLEERETVILADNEGAYLPTPGAEVLPVRHDHGMVASEESVRTFALHRKVKPGAVRLKEFDFERPSLDVQATAFVGTPSAGPGNGGSIPPPSTMATPVPGNTAERALLVYDHQGDYEGDQISREAAGLQLRQRRRRAEVALAESHCALVRPGHVFTLDEHPRPEVNQPYVVVEVFHTARRAAVAAAGQSWDVGELYENRFTCVRADVPCLPKQPPERTQQVMETATVTGPPSEEIYVDPYGRIKVQFHWDLEGRRDEHSSCWIRPMQPWAGAGWGHQFIPRIGMEVLVLFTGGDTDRPMILGAAYNGEHPPPFGLPGSKTRSGIRTESSPGGAGYNELSFEDQKGAEELYVRAERDLVAYVGNDRQAHVKRDESRTVGRDEKTDVLADRLLTVRGQDTQTVHGSRREQVLGARTGDVAGGDRIHVGGPREIWLDEGSFQSVGRSDRHVITDHYDRSVGGDSTERTHGNHRLSVGSYDLTVREGATLSTTRAFSVGAGRAVTLRSFEAIRFVCGNSSIELKPDEIVLVSKKLTTNTEDTTLFLSKDLSIALADGQVDVEAKQGVKLAAKQLDLFADGATVSLAQSQATISAQQKVTASSQLGALLMLDSTAELDGAPLVKLASGGSASGQFKDPKIEAKRTSYVDIALVHKHPKAGSDPLATEDRPVAGARYVVTASDGTVYDGVLDSEGKARVRVCPGPAKVSFPDFDAQAVQKK